jgi:chemotaxis protein histidine kinase CheA
MLDMSQYREAFLTEARASVARVHEAIAKLRLSVTDTDALFEVVRFFHMLKSSSAMMGYEKMSEACRDREKLVRRAYEGGEALTEAEIDVLEKSVREMEKELGL